MRVISFLTVLVTVLATTLVAAPPAQAATCYYTSCTNRDPQAYGCNVGAETKGEFTAFDGEIPYLHVELRYSPTCVAVWARATPLIDGRAGPLWNYVVAGRWSTRTGGSPNWLRIVNQPLRGGEAAWTAMHAWDEQWYSACVSDSSTTINGPCTSPRR